MKTNSLWMFINGLFVNIGEKAAWLGLLSIRNFKSEYLKDGTIEFVRFLICCFWETPLYESVETISDKQLSGLSLFWLDY